MHVLVIPYFLDSDLEAVAETVRQFKSVEQLIDSEKIVEQLIDCEKTVEQLIDSEKIVEQLIDMSIIVSVLYTCQFLHARQVIMLLDFIEYLPTYICCTCI
jgi:hypothetical protein